MYDLRISAFACSCNCTMYFSINELIPIVTKVLNKSARIRGNRKIDKGGGDEERGRERETTIERGTQLPL